MQVKRSTDTDLLCPSCGEKGRPVKPVTIESLVTEPARTRAGRSDGFRFCAEPSCDVAYYHAETGQRIHRCDVSVRVGQKETTPPRPVCYCFDHTVEDIEAEVKETGTSRIPDSIAERCRQGLDRCEETNPQGACCLANVRRALKDAQATLGRDAPVAVGSTSPSHDSNVDCCAVNTTSHSAALERWDAGIIAQIGALGSAVVASACCWLPLLLIAVGISGGAVAATFEAWRPVLLPVTFVLLGVAFYFTYRRPRVAGLAGSYANASGDDCCCVPEAGTVEPCCPPGSARGMMLKKVNKAMLWVVTAFVLAFAFFPNYVGYLLGGSNTLAMRNDLDIVVVDIEGMTCEACAASIEDSLRKVPSVAAAKVSYEKRQAIIGLPRGSQQPREAILSAIAHAGNYRGRIAEQVQWTLAIEGMTCEGCASGLQAALSKMPGVRAASVSYEEKRAVVTTTPPVSEEVLRNAVSQAGYSVKSAARE